MMKKTRKKTLIFGVCTLMLTGISFGQTSPEQKKTVAEMFKEMDINEDKKLSLQELKEPLKQDFKKMDLDQNGFISLTELEKAMEPEKEKPTR